MHALEVFTETDLTTLIRKRKGEIKLGESVQYCKTADWKKELKDTSAKFVLLGIPEDIGVRANLGRGGAHTAFKPALESFLNQQDNFFLKGDTIFVLGNVMVNDLMGQSSSLNSKNHADLLALREMVSQIDYRVEEVINYIVSLQKIPVVIGGGHNNAYGNIAGCFKALQTSINVINCDPHSDLREAEGRHSGNGFSYALEHNYLNKYAVFALHEQYNNQSSLKQFIQNTNLHFVSFEDIFIKEKYDFKTALQRSINFVKGKACGVEIDLDAITNVPSSAKTSSGISQLQARQFIHHCASQLNPMYLHVAEGAPVLSHIKADNKTGKLISYLITDFIKGHPLK